MDGSSAPPPPNSKQTVGGASKYLAHLPSRGFFSSSTVLSSNPGGLRVYVCDHETSPPEDQVIKTNQTNILIRSLMLKKQKGDSSSKDVKGTAASETSRKRPAEKAMDARTSAKRAATNTQVGSRQEASKSRATDKDFQNLTVERLRSLLKDKGLSVRGKKDDLIARLRGANG